MRKPTKFIAATAVLVLLAAAIGIAIQLQSDPPKQTELAVNPTEPEATTTSPEPAGQPETPRAAEEPEGHEQANPPNDTPEQELQTMPVRWLTEPLEFPTEGMPFELSMMKGGKRHPGGTVHRDRVVFEPLPDGQYTWIDSTPIHIGSRGQPTLSVSSGAVEIRITDRSRIPLTEIPLFYTVPVRLKVTLNGRSELPICTVCVSGDDPKGLVFRSWVVLHHGVELETHVPMGSLQFFEAHKGLTIYPPYGDREVVSSLGDRPPEPNELIELKPIRNSELIVAVGDQPPGWLQSALLLPDGSTADLATCHASVEVEGWSTTRRRPFVRPSRPLSEQVVDSGSSLVLQELSFPTTPLEQDTTVFFQLRLENNRSDFSKRIDKTIAVGEARLLAKQDVYRVDLHPVQYVGEVTVKVVDKDGVPRPHQEVRARAFLMALGKQQVLPGGGSGRTDAEGKIVFKGVAVLPGACFQAEFKAKRVQRLLTPGETTLEIDIVVDSDTVQPLVFELVPDDLSEEELDRIKPMYSKEGNRLATADRTVTYAVTTTTRNSLFSKSYYSSIEDNWLVFTDYVGTGPFTALLETPFGEYIVTGRHDRLASEPVKVRLESSRQIKVHCVDASGDSMERVVVWTPSADLQQDWGRAAELEHEYHPTYHDGRRVTRKDGNVTLMRRVSSADPSAWRYFHAQHGLMHATETTGDAESGYRVVLAPMPGQATVTVRVPYAKGQARVVLRLYGPEDIYDARTNLGAVKPVEGAEVVFTGVPAGSYEIKMFEFVEQGYGSPPKENCIRIEVAAGGTQTVTLPSKE